MIAQQSENPPSVLFAWELGANLGHVKPMTTLARALIAQGARVTFAVRDLAGMRLVAKPGEFQVLQAPLWPEHRHTAYRPSAAGYADVLTLIGFGDAQKLGATVAGWDTVLALVKPGVVVADHAPALQVALYGRELPLVCMGTPFTMPPLTLDRLPPIRADQAPSLPEARLLQSAKTVLAERGVPAPQRLVDLLRAGARLVFGAPELDPYRAYRDEPLLAPPEPLPKFVEAPAKPRLFVYAGADLPHVETLVQSLVVMDVDIVAYLRGDVGPLPHFLKHRGHQVFDEPPPLEEILPSVSHVLSQGGAFTCHAALAAGRPHLIMPLHNESEINFAQLYNIGAARRLELSSDEVAVRRTVHRFLIDADLVRNVRHWALTLAARQQADGTDAAVNAIERCLAARNQILSSRRRVAAAAAQPS